MALNAKQQRFVEEYLIDSNATQAAIRAGYSPKTAQEQSSRLLSNVMVKQAIQVARDAIAERAEFTAADVLKELVLVATANPNDLVEHRRVCCIGCYLPLMYDQRKPINIACPVCFGDGVGVVLVKDTRYLSPSARRLYAGVKVTKDGHVEVKMRDQDAALVNIGKTLGMFIDRQEISGRNGSPIAVTGTDLTKLTNEELATLETILTRAAVDDASRGPSGTESSKPQ